MQKKINYSHLKNLHTLRGPLRALPILFPKGIPKKILDIGCGTGTWLSAAKILGAKEVLGIDGVNIPDNIMKIKKKEFLCKDLTKPIKLKKNFNVVLCLEVAEHLDKKYSDILLRTLTNHSDTILFSAACPGQKGENHLNCRWPDYWQKKFNKLGFKCIDAYRQKIWEIKSIEPWYRQNIFLAKKSKNAGNEQRIKKILHPDMFLLQKPTEAKRTISCIEKGSQKTLWYLKTPFKALFYKVKRKLYFK